MKKALLSFALLFFLVKSYSQCMLKPVSMAERVNTSSLIAEGEVVYKISLWDAGHQNIYTVNEIKVYKMFKGSLSGDRIYIITEGGQVGLDRQYTTSVLETEMGDRGIFACYPSRVSLPVVSENGVLNTTVAQYEATASAQGFIKFDDDFEHAADPFNHYLINPDLYNDIIDLTGDKPTIINEWNPEATLFTDATPVITSYSDSATAGTKTVITIKGSNFGTTRGSGYVAFKNPDNGGSSTNNANTLDYIYWSDTMIKVRVPSAGGTGKVLVSNGSSSVETSGPVTISFAQLNVSYNSNYFQPDHVNSNSSGGYTWQFYTGFYSNTPARAAFIRAFQSWRCGTYVNWDIGSNSTVNTIAADGVNIIRFDIGTELPSGVLGRCTSRWSGCFTGSDTTWYVNELDIAFDDGTNWNYNTSGPSGSQYDFESVAVHELGHGHQLGHVINSNEIMHYSIANGQSKHILSINDLAGGNYVMSQSIVNNSCGPGKMTALSPGACSLIPVAGFSASVTTLCPSASVTFTDSSKGSTNSYAWDFGSGAVPPTASTKGPHTVLYATPGPKTVRLIVSGILGDDTAKKVDYITILVDKPAKPGAISGPDTGCLKQQLFTINSVTNATTYTWGINGSGNTDGSTDTSALVTFSTGGAPATVWVKASNSCGSSDSMVKSIPVLSNPKAQFTYNIIANDTIRLTNTSTNAGSYTWKFGNNQTADFTNLDIIPQGSGTYAIKLVAMNYCGADSTTQNIPFVKASIFEINNKAGVSVYPNPMNDAGTIEVKNISGYGTLDFVMYDITGRQVRQISITEQLTDLKKEGLSEGTYIFKLSHNGETVGSGRVVLK